MRIEHDPDGRVFTIIERLDEIPSGFASEADEAAWWDTHDFSEELRASFASQPVPGAIARLLPARRTPTSDPAST